MEYVQHSGSPRQFPYKEFQERSKLRTDPLEARVGLHTMAEKIDSKQVFGLLDSEDAKNWKDWTLGGVCTIGYHNQLVFCLEGRVVVL